jgi:diphosphomevalonate decarboxylase
MLRQPRAGAAGDLMMGFGKAAAHSNIALAKYWGKADAVRNLTAVPSLSLTLAALCTVTSVRFDDALPADEFLLAGELVGGRPLSRVSKLLDTVRAQVGVDTPARVESTNDFPTAAGLASSASGFAALAMAATRAAGLELGLSEVSALARAASASAARSVFGGYRAWLEAAPAVYEEVRSAVLAADFAALGPAVEHSALMMHASMFAARPALIYFAPATLRVMERVRAFRKSGGRAFFTMDAGPHVKVLVEPSAAAELELELAKLEGVSHVLRSAAGPDAYWIDP